MKSPSLPSFGVLRRLVVCSLLVAAAVGASAQYAMFDAFKANPGASLDVSGANTLKVSKKVLVPTLYLRVAVEGSVFVAKSKGSSTASAKGRYAIQGLDREALVALATKLQAEYIAQLKAAGWEVLTYADISGDKGVTEMERQKGEGALNFPMQKDASGVTFAIVSPSEAQNFKPAFQGPTWPFRFVGKELNATVLIPQIDLVSPQVWAETRKGYKSASAEIKTAPGMNMNYAMVMGHTPKGGGLLIKLKHAVVNTTAEAGTFTDAKDKSPTGANALSKGLSILGGGGSINRASVAYVFTIDPPKFEAGILAGGEAFLGASVKAMGKP
jgi:hypothetical protein